MRVISLFIILAMFISLPSNVSLAAEGDIPLISEDGKYHLQIIMYQWQFDVYNLQGNYSITEAMKENKYIASSGSNTTIGPFLTSTGIIFEIYSRDVQHGFSIPELDLAIATNRPSVGEELGEKSYAETILPSEPAIIGAFCHIFCGLGHPDEKMKFEVVADLDDYMTSESDNLRLSFLILPLIISMSSIVLLIKRKRLKM